MKNRLRFLLWLAEGSVIAALVLACVIPFSCRISEEGISLIGGDFTAPVIEDFSVIDGKTVKLSFSEPVQLSALVLSPRINGISDSESISQDENLSTALAAAAGEYGRINASFTCDEDEKVYSVVMEEETCVGASYEMYGIVEDNIGNSLTFCIPFTGYNSQVPRIIMTEVQIKYGKGTIKGEVIYRGEYVELLALEEGNLAGLVLESASDGSDKSYSFPAINVKKGEIILLHLRTVGEGCVNEDGDDLTLASAPHSAAGIRDLWSENTSSRFNDNSDVIILKDTVNGIIMDAVMYAPLDATEWKSSIADYAQLVYQAGAYDSEDITSASISKGCTTLKSLTRCDCKDIYENIVRENNEDYDFPFVSDENSWQVTAVSPGYL